jgi:hypothetical protein
LIVLISKKISRTLIPKVINCRSRPGSVKGHHQELELYVDRSYRRDEIPVSQFFDLEGRGGDKFLREFGTQRRQLRKKGEMARVTAEAKLGFYIHLAVYAATNSLIFLIWVVHRWLLRADIPMVCLSPCILGSWS